MTRKHSENWNLSRWLPTQKCINIYFFFYIYTIIYQPLAYLSIHLPSLNKISWLALRFKTEPIPGRLPPDHLGAPAMVSETKGIEGAPPRRVVQMNSGPARLLPSCHDALLTSDISWGNYRNSHPSNNIQDTSFFQTLTPQKHRSAKIDT